MSIKLTDTQLIVLSAAAQREDHCLVATKSLKGGVAQKFAAKLLTAGLVKEIKAKPGMPAWRRDEDAGQSQALKLTAAGLKAIAVDDSDVAEEAADRALPPGDEAVSASTVSGTGSIASPAPLVKAASSASSPREGTKLAQVIGLLRRNNGATLAELVAATGWLPHTTRAALTGLRKRGYAVELDRSNKEVGSTYSIGAGEDAGEENKTLPGDERPHTNESLAEELPAATGARPKPAVPSTQRERIVRSPKRKAA